MNNLVGNELLKIRDELDLLKEKSDDYILNHLILKYFFKNGNEIVRADDRDYVFDGKSDGGIDFGYKLDDNDRTMYLGQCKNYSSIGSHQNIIDAFTKMQRFVIAMEKHNSSKYSEKARRVFRNLEDKFENYPEISLNYYTTATVSDEIRKKVNAELNSSKFEDFQCEIYDITDINKKIESVKKRNSFIKEDAIKVCKEDGLLSHSDVGCVVSVSARSLFKLYEKYNKDLFGQNFRLYVQNKKIDDKIVRSLRKNRSDFWALNNGIIIGCSEFVPDGDNIKLYDFSIINGCQTTTLIGKFWDEGWDDFYINCKIINNKKEKDDFISEIAEASNSQKPIKDRDLKSNRKEMKILKECLENHDPKIYLEIKRGEKVKYKKNCPKWLRSINNEKLGQLMLAVNFQQPGAARSQKSKIFGDEKFYKKLFKRKVDTNNIYDLLYINEMLNNYANSKRSDNLGDRHKDVLSNGKFFILATISLYIRCLYKVIDVEDVSNVDDSIDILHKDNFKGSFLNVNRSDEEKEIFYNIFEETIYEIENIIPDNEAISNFCKLDSKYKKFIKSFIPKHFNRRGEMHNFMKELFLYDDITKKVS